MTRSRLSSKARALLDADLDSLEKLEVMRHVRSSGGGVTRAALAAAPHLDREAVDELLRGLADVGLVELGEGGAVRPGPRAADATVDELMQLYDEDRPLVVTALSTKAMDRIRTMAARTFGEALVSRKKPSGNNDDP